MCKLSIIVPVYNVAQYLEECLNSIINQTYKEWELIIVDDGSNDGSEKICDKYASDKIKVFHQKNAGLSSARNLGLQYSKGKYISFIDSDDVILPDYYTILVYLAEKHKADIVCSVISKYDKIPDNCNISEEILNTDEAMKQLIIQNKFNHGVCMKIFKSELAKQVVFKVGYTSEDVLYSYETFKIAQKVVFTNYSGYIYRIRDNSITTSPFKQKNFDLFKIMLEVKKDIKKSFPQHYSIFTDKFFYCKLYYLKKSIELNNFKEFKSLYNQATKNINFDFIKFAFTKSNSVNLFFQFLFLGFLPRPLIMQLPLKFVSNLKKALSQIIHNEKTYKYKVFPSNNS
ncbi:MAG: glycosyltransferase [Clostridia bacterium]|nr:glycosyltransferase [Clostridia bacterium]